MAYCNDRYDSSLGILTKKFVTLIKGSPSGVLSLNEAAHELQVQKRRIYDITNVLEGIGMIEKRSKNNIAWKGAASSGPASSTPGCELEVELEALRAGNARLEREEARLDRGLNEATALRQSLLDEHRADLYLTHADIRSVPALRRATIVGLCAPADTVLEVPEPSAGDEYDAFAAPRLYELQLRSAREPIDVFLVARSFDDAVSSQRPATALRVTHRPLLGASGESFSPQPPPAASSSTTADLRAPGEGGPFIFRATNSRTPARQARAGSRRGSLLSPCPNSGVLSDILELDSSGAPAPQDEFLFNLDEHAPDVPDLWG